MATITLNELYKVAPGIIVSLPETHKYFTGTYLGKFENEGDSPYLFVNPDTLMAYEVFQAVPIDYYDSSVESPLEAMHAAYKEDNPELFEHLSVYGITPLQDLLKLYGHLALAYSDSQSILAGIETQIEVLKRVLATPHKEQQ
jgi:hypothetical protein